MKRSSTNTCEFTPMYFPPRNWNASSYANQGYTKGPFKSENREREVLVLSLVFLWFSYLFFVIYPLFTFNAHFQRWKSITKVKVTLLCCVVISTFPCGYGSDALWSHNGNLSMRGCFSSNRLSSASSILSAFCYLVYCMTGKVWAKVGTDWSIIKRMGRMHTTTTANDQ